MCLVLLCAYAWGDLHRTLYMVVVLYISSAQLLSAEFSIAIDPLESCTIQYKSRDIGVFAPLPLQYVLHIFMYLIPCTSLSCHHNLAI